MNPTFTKIEYNEFKKFREEALRLWGEICKNKEDRLNIHKDMTKLRKKLYGLSHLIPKQIEQYEELVFRMSKMPVLEMEPLAEE